MRYVRYTGSWSSIRKGQKALMREDGKVQFDYGYGGWACADLTDPRCHGWHDCGDEWVDIKDE